MQEIKFFFSVKDPQFTTKTTVVDNSPSNYISHAFVRCPIYDKYSSKQIGYKVSDDYVQQVATNKYVVRLNNTYTFHDKHNRTIGTISWQYVFENNKPEIYYPVDVVASSTIISGTGIYKRATGSVYLLPKPNGKRLVKIKLDNNYSCSC
jgi:hemolysin-activating ACP:hemolysin acyltransferase